MTICVAVKVYDGIVEHLIAHRQLLPKIHKRALIAITSLLKMQIRYLI